MTKKQLVIQHDLSKLDDAALAQYLRDVSTFIGLDPDLNGLDTIWMVNENGPGQSKVVYARRGTAEILRNQMGIDVDDLTDHVVNGSIVFTAKGHNKEGRKEQAVGSKFLGGLQGKALDDAIMTASTRALRRLTMQFTSLGILDESEVGAVKNETANPAAAATLLAGPMVIPPAPMAAPNSAPGRDVTPAPSPATVAPPTVAITNVPALPAPPVIVQQPDMLNPPSQDAKLAGQPAPDPTPCGVCKTPLDTHTFVAGQGMVCPAAPAEAPQKPKRARKKANTVSMEGPEPEVVSNPAPTPEVAPQPAPAPPATFAGTPHEALTPPTPTIPPVSSLSAASAPPQSTEFAGKPTEAQMADYRKRVGVFTAELPSSESMGSVQKMRAFITRQTGAAPQFMTTDQWEEMLGWFEAFVAKNAVKGLVKYINDSLGVK